MSLSEADLVAKIEIYLQKKFDTNLTFREVSAGYGIADLVIAPSETDSEMGERHPITNFGILKYYLELNKKKYSYGELLSSAKFTSEQETKKYISFLIKNNYLTTSDRITYKKNNILSNGSFQKIIAIEAKLTDYKNGIIQAKRYQYFADQSYLAILKSASKNIDIKDLTMSGIGLILFDEKTENIKIIKPKACSNVQEKIYKIFAGELMLSRINLSSAS